MRLFKKKIDIQVEKTKTGYSAYAEDLNVFSTAKTINELYQNLVEALNLHFHDRNVMVQTSNLRLNIDLQQFFSYYRVLNARFLAERIGMHPTLLSQYVTGVKKPGAKQVRRILNGIHEIGLELSDLRLL